MAQRRWTRVTWKKTESDQEDAHLAGPVRLDFVTVTGSYLAREARFIKRDPGHALTDFSRVASTGVVGRMAQRGQGGKVRKQVVLGTHHAKTRSLLRSQAQPY